MALDVEFYRRTVYVPAEKAASTQRRISAIDIQPEGAKQTLIFVHGYGGNALQWLNQLRFFGQTMRVVAPDMRGHGLSDDQADLPYTLDGLVADLALVLTALEVERPYSIVAHSFGGAVATEFALRPEHASELEGLILIGVPTHFRLRTPMRYALSVPDPFFSFLARRLKVALFAPQQTLKRLHDDVMSRWAGAERLSKLRLPALIVLGQRDVVFLRQYYEDVPRCMPQAQKVVISVSAHLVQLERPDAVNRAIRRFLVPRAASGPLGGARSSLARLIEMPWLQHYDNEVPEQLPLPKQRLHHLLSNTAREFPERPALLFSGQRISYRELDLLSNRFAQGLRGLGLHPGDRVAIILPNIPQCVIAFYGALKAGAVVVMGSPLSTEAEILHQLNDSEASVVLTLNSYQLSFEKLWVKTAVQRVIYTDVREYLPLTRRLLLVRQLAALQLHTSAPHVGPQNAGVRTEPSFHAFQRLLRTSSASLLDSETATRDIALIQYTGGTTDTPKGVILTHSNLLINATQVRHWLSEARRGQEVILGALPLSHSYGVTGCLNLAVGLAAALILLPTVRTEEMLKAIHRHHPTIFPGVPAFYLAIANYPHVRKYGVSTIRVCISGSASLPIEVQEAFEKLTHGHLLEGYGLTEAAPVTHANPLKGERHSGSIGVPLPGTQARIVHPETGALLAPGEIGELLIKGPQMMRGYWHLPLESEQALQDGWLHTGDLASVDEDGFFTIVDREKDLILAGPYNIYPHDVEEVLYDHPKVLEVAVVKAGTGVESKNGESNGLAAPFLKAVVVLKQGERATTDELLAFCRERLDAYKVPQQIEFRTELPKNIVGKVLRRLLIES